MIQSGTDNALKRIESNEEDDSQMYETLSQIAPTETGRIAIQAVKHAEQVHSGAIQKTYTSSPNTLTGPQVMLDPFLHRGSWHRSGGGWIGQAIYGAIDGLGSVFGIV